MYKNEVLEFNSAYLFFFKTEYSYVVLFRITLKL